MCVSVCWGVYVCVCVKDRDLFLELDLTQLR